MTKKKDTPPPKQTHPNEATCPRHGVKSYDFLSLNTKKQPVFRCAKTEPTHAFYMFPHYFTVRGDA